MSMLKCASCLCIRSHGGYVGSRSFHTLVNSCAMKSHNSGGYSFRGFVLKPCCASLPSAVSTWWFRWLHLPLFGVLRSIVGALGICTHSSVVGFLDLPPNIHWSKVTVCTWLDDSNAIVSGSLHVEEQFGIQYGVAGCSIVAGIPRRVASIIKSRLTRSSAFPVCTCFRSYARMPL